MNEKELNNLITAANNAKSCLDALADEFTRHGIYHYAGMVQGHKSAINGAMISVKSVFEDRDNNK